jgi:nicotinamide mononucleotide transporter
MNWITEHIIEIVGAVLGLAFLYLEIKENKWLWPVGILTSVLYIYVFFVEKLYADMSLQFYYVFMSIYGWVLWSKGVNAQNKFPVISLKRGLFIILFFVSVLIYVLISYVLVNFTDSTVPYWDAFTTALSIVATWMLAKKILEQWLVWVVVNAVSLALYIYKGMYPTTVLFFFYTVLAAVGYIKWKKEMNSEALLQEK